MTAHTPKPWRRVERYSTLPGEKEPGLVALNIEHKGRCIAGVTIRPDIPAMANARLIAAAPELLEAAQDLLTDIDNVDATVLLKGGPVSPSLVVNLRAAIAKATGEAS